MTFTVAAERPVDQITREILRHAAEATRTAQITYFVGGALARDLLLYHVFGVPRARLTRDVDLMAFVEDWRREGMIDRTWDVHSPGETSCRSVGERRPGTRACLPAQ